MELTKIAVILLFTITMFLASSRSSPIQTRKTSQTFSTRFTENPHLRERNYRRLDLTEQQKLNATAKNVNDGKIPTAGVKTKEVAKPTSENPPEFQYNPKAATADHELFYKLFQGARTRVKRQQCSAAIKRSEACGVIMVTCANGCGIQTCTCNKTGDVIPIKCTGGSFTDIGYCH